jgi:hypothetical protein
MSGKDTGQPRSPGRRAVDRAAAEARLPVSATPPHPDKPRAKSAKDAPPADAGLTAQLLGEGPRRGLKGGAETLGRARATYLGTEYSGPADRRPKKGRITKTDV